MSIPQLCIRRPVFTIVISIVLILLGVMNYSKLPIRKLPNINNPVISIYTEFEGASPELVEKEITTPIENAIAGTSGIETMRSVSQLGNSNITLKFQLNADIQEALGDIRNKVIALSSYLPEGAKTPVVNKNDRDWNPALIIGFVDQKKSALEISDYLKRHVKTLIEEVDGVSQVFEFGSRDYAIKIWLDPAKMMARHVTINDIKKVLKEQNIDMPSGQIKSKNRYYTVVTHAKLTNANDFKRVIISDKQGMVTRVADVAKVAITSNNDESYLRINGKPAVGLAVIPQANANPVRVAKDIKKILHELKPLLPQTMQAKVVFDSTTYITKSVKEVYKALIEAVLFVILVIFLFLGNLRAAIIPIVTVPICLIAAFWPMHLLGFGINTITLLALVLAIGLVVDDAIVMLENIYRHMQQGKTCYQAALEGSNEIVFAILAMTLTLAAVYAPMGFVNGFTGKLFLQFGVTLSIAVVISGIVALTLTPMMCSKLLSTKHNRYSLFIDTLFAKLMSFYQKVLRVCLQRKTWVLLSLALLLSGGIYLYKKLPAELAPMEDQSYVFGIISSPTNSSVDYTDYYARKLERIYTKVPERSVYLSSVRPDGAFSVISLKPWSDRTRTQQQITNELNQAMQSLAGVNAFAVTPAPLGRGSSDNSSFSLKILSNGSYETLNDAIEAVVTQLNKYPGLNNVKNNLSLDSEQIDISINRNLAADLEVNLTDIAETISTMLGGSNPVNFTFDGQVYQVILKLERSARTTPQVLDKLYINSARNKAIPLSSLVTIKNSIGPESLPHSDRLRAAKITAEIAPNYDMNQVISDVKTMLSTHLPDGYQYTFGGAAKDYLESSGKTLLAFMLALTFIYLVLAAQFESFIDPFIILLSVPLTLIAALVGLKLTSGSLNIYTNIGMVTLIGLIAKHGILITEFANQLMAEGKDKIEALIESASLRLRPIMMTTAAMVLGALPLTLAFGAGAESRQQLGIVIVFGMFFGTFFSLIVVPLAYAVLKREKKIHSAENKSLAQPGLL